MDLGTESVEENELNHDGDENGTRDGDSIGDENLGLGFDGNSGANTDQKEEVVDEGSGDASSSKGTPTKGFGLKKWKRIRRDVVKDPNSSAESGKVLLKRGLSGSGNANLSENQPFSRDVKEKNDGSSNTFGNVVFPEGFAGRGSSSDSRYAVGSGFVVGTDSENSEDRSSKSSTAASEPKIRHDKSRSKNTNSKNVGNTAQRVLQQGKGRIESSKNPGGGAGVRIEKENSISSMESDSRSSNIRQGVFSVTSNGKHNGRPFIYDGGNGSEALINEHLTEGVEASYGNENIGEDDDLLPENSVTNLSWGATEEKSVNNQSSNMEDPLIESIRSLLAVQEALEEGLSLLFSYKFDFSVNLQCSLSICD